MSRRSLVAIVSLLALAVAAFFFWPGSAQTPSEAEPQAPDERPAPTAASLPGPTPSVLLGRVTGRVVDGDAGVPRARVTLRGARTLTAWTLDDGAFLLDDVPPGQALLSAAAGERASPVQQVTVSPPTPVEALLELEPAIGVRGTVRSLVTQGPVAGATVTWSGGLVRTGEDGTFTLGAARGHTWVDVAAPGYLSRLEWLPLEGESGRPVDVVLTPASRLEGTVKVGGAPVAGASVWAEATEGARRGERTPFVLTGPKGEFALECGEGVRQLSAATPSGTRLLGPQVRVAVGETRTGLAIDAPEVFSASGVVLRAGQPVAGAQLAFIEAGREEQLATALTGADGRFVVDELPRHRFVVQVRHGASTSMAGPYEHTGQPWTIEIKAGLSLAGKVVPPSAGVVVRWRSGQWAGPPPETTTDGEGRFRFDDVGEGLLLVDASGPAGAGSVEGRAGQEVTVQLRKAEVVLTVTDESGAPVTDGLVLARSVDTGAVQTLMLLAPGGVFRFPLPSGQWELSVEARGRGRTDSTTVRVAGDSVAASLRLKAARSLAGVVRDARSKLPLQGARVTADGQGTRVSVVTGADGTFRTPSLVGVDGVWVYRDGYRPAGRRAGAELLDIELVPVDGNHGAVPETPQFEGVGMVLRSEGGRVVVERVNEGSPAERANMRPGDVVALVDGVPAAGDDLNGVVQRIRGPAGTAVTLMVERGGVQFPVVLRRRFLNF